MKQNEVVNAYEAPVVEIVELVTETFTMESSGEEFNG